MDKYLTTHNMRTRLGLKLDRFAHKFLDRRLVFVMDVCISLFATILVAVVSYFLGVDQIESRQFTIVWGVSSVLSSALMFYLLKTYTIVIRHFTFKDTLVMGLAVLGKAILICACIALFSEWSGAVPVLMFADGLVALVLLCLVRLLMIVVYDTYKARLHDAQKRVRVLVYGVSDKSISSVVRLRNSTHYEVCGFLSPNDSLKETKFVDKNVYTFTDAESLRKLIDKLSLSGLIFATMDDLQKERDNLVGHATSSGLRVLVVPTIDEFSGNMGDGSLKLREVKIEDLLGRDEIKISIDAVKKTFEGKVVMVTGAAGSIGSELCRQLATFSVRKLVLFDNAETPMHNLRLELEKKFPELDFVPIIGDVRQVPRLDFAFRTYKPQVVFHAAAYKHVPLMEENPCEAVYVNVVGSRNVADKCIEYGVDKMVMISTDKAVNPTNIMGCTKRLAEIYIQSLGLAIERGEIKGHTKFVTTRFGNVLGSNGSVIPLFRSQISAGGPVTVTHKDITRFFMTIPEACRLVMEAVTMPTENRICVFDMGKPVKIDTLARRMIELSGLVPDVDIKIEYSGLRPGEKLYEEVLSNVENTEPTTHEKIRIARVREYDYATAVQVCEQLEELSKQVEIPEMVKLMKRTVPEYISNNSRFEEYDKKQS